MTDYSVDRATYDFLAGERRYAAADEQSRNLFEAFVRVTRRQGFTFRLEELAGGVYSLSCLNPMTDKAAVLRLRCAEGKYSASHVALIPEENVSEGGMKDIARAVLLHLHNPHWDDITDRLE